MIMEAVRAEFDRILSPERVYHAPAELMAYSFDGTFQQHLPDLVVSPTTTEEVSQILQVADRESLTVITRGAGTSLTGGTIPVGGGVVVNLAAMNRILEIDTANTVAVVEPGVITANLQAAVEKTGFFYPPDPASLNQSSIGGNVSCNAGGPRCLKYGVTGDYVLGMTVVLVDGRVLRLGGKLVKNVTGYQLDQLFIGSEGTLGVITQVILRLIPLPKARGTALVTFDSVDGAGQAVSAILAAGILPVACEMADRATINAVEDYLGMGLPRTADAMLILEQDGNDQALAMREVERMAEVCAGFGMLSVRTAESEADRAALWQARRAISGALGRLGPNKLGEDIVVPRSQIAEMVRRVEGISKEIGLPLVVFGHAGDGNLHPNIIFDRRKPGEVERVEQAAAAIFRAALELGGTLSGEHGIGTLKREFLEDDLGPDAVEIMRGIKRVLDPKGLLNPHKVFPERPGTNGHSGFLTALPSLEGITPG
jgi:glycolate oxidase